MALMSCPECGGNVSDYSEVCIHCGFPIKSYIEQKKRDAAEKQLAEKVIQTRFTCPEPRAKVCAKCGEVFYYLWHSDGTIKEKYYDKPRCMCGCAGVEVDYPAAQVGQKGSFEYIARYASEHNIGDRASPEYQLHAKAIKSLYHSKEYPPDRIFFGRRTSKEPIPESDERVKELRKKLRPIEYKFAPPRRKVCLNCGRMFYYDYYMGSGRVHWGFDMSQCDCGMPGVEVDYPVGAKYKYQQQTCVERYIFENCIDKQNIGDRDSAQFLRNKESIYERVKKCIECYGEETIHSKPMPPQKKFEGWWPTVILPKPEPFVAPSPTPKPEPRLPHCPFCSSTDLTKISSVGKAVKILALGLYGMDDAGKTYRCNNCGGKF